MRCGSVRNGGPVWYRGPVVRASSPQTADQRFQPAYCRFPAYWPLYTELDEAVAAAYGWPKDVAHNSDEVVQRLLELNRAIAAGKRAYDPFGTQAAATAEMFLRAGGFTRRARPARGRR